MTETSDTTTTSARGNRRKEPGSFPGLGRSSGWTTIAALAIAVIAILIAIGSWFRPAHEGAPKFGDQQISDAKAHTCGSYTTVREGVRMNTHLENPTPGDPTGQLAVAANARLALVGGGAYLRDRLDAEPATPGDLVNAVKSMANTIEQLGVNYLAGAANIVQDPLRQELDSEIGQIDGMCA